MNDPVPSVGAPDPFATAVAGARRPGTALLRAVLRRERRRVGLAALGGISHQACEALVPVVIGVIVDRAIEPSDGGALLLWIGLLAVLFLVLSLSYRLFATVGIRALEQSEHELRMSLTRRILDPGGLALAADAGARGGVGGSAGSLLSVTGADARQAALVVQAVGLAAAVLSALAVTAVVLLGISLPLGLLVLLGTPPLVALLQRVAVPLRARSVAEQAHAADASAVATDLIRGVRVLKGIGAERTAVARYREASQASLRATLRAAVANNVLDAANVLISGVLLVVVAYVGGRMAVAGTISVGDLVAAVGLTQFLIGPLQRIGYATGLLAQSRASAERVATVLGAPAAVADLGATTPDRSRGGLRLAELPLGASAVGTLALEIAPGEHVGIVAPDPLDATALLDLLARRVDPASGAVWLDDVGLGELPLAESHRRLLVADHDADLFEGTIAENVRAATPTLAADRRDAALLASGTDEMVATLAGGLEAPVGERGRLLSGGQRQRVALARALAADPPVLVVHDPTTAVDAVTEARIADGVRRLRRGRTTVVVASSPTLLAACDRVVLVEGGTVAAVGTHDELGRHHAGYREAVLR